MRNTLAIFAFSAFCCLVSCDSRPSAPSGAGADFGGWSWYALNTPNAGTNEVDVSATWGSWNTKLVYLILTDVDATATTNVNASGTRTEYNVHLVWPKGRKAELRIETADGKTGRAVYAGQTYDLAEGSVFVLLPKDEKLELRQLRRDISEVAGNVPSVQKLIRDDPELARMFSKLK